MSTNSDTNEKKRKVALTTIDNPFSPFDDFIKWYMFDIEKGYKTCEYLARIAETSPNFTDEENDLEIEEAIDKIIKEDFLEIYKKIETFE